MQAEVCRTLDRGGDAVPDSGCAGAAGETLSKRNDCDESSYQLQAEQYGSTLGELVLLDSERALLKQFLPRGWALRLIDHVDCEESARGKPDVEHGSGQAARKGRPSRKAAPAPHRHLPAMPAPRDVTGSTPRRSTREHKVPERWHALSEMEQPAPAKRMKGAPQLQRASKAQAKEPQSMQQATPREHRRRAAAKDRNEPARTPSLAEEKRKEKRQKGRLGSMEPEQDDAGGSGASANGGDADAVCSHHVVSQQEKGELQAKLDQLDNDQLDRVIDFLKLDMGDNLEGQEIQLDLDTLTPGRRHALIKFVDAELRKVSSIKAKLGTSGSADAAAGMPLMSPAFPVIEPGATPLAAATPVVATLTPRRELDSSGPAACAAKRQLAWEVCSAREVQRQSHLREVREAASVGGTPQSLTPAAVEPLPSGALPVMPEMMLPPAAADSGALQAAASAPAKPAGPTAAGLAPAAAKPCPAAAEVAGAPGPSAPALAAAGDSMLESTAEVLNMLDFGWT